MAAMFRRILGRINPASHRKSDLTKPSPSSNHDNETPNARFPKEQTNAEPKKPAIFTSGVLVAGAPHAGINALARRLGMDVWSNVYDPTGSMDYRKGHPQPDGGLVIMEYMAATWPTEYLALFQLWIRDHDIILLVYRVDDDETNKLLEDVYAMYIVPKHPPAVRVYVVATCADLLPPDGTGREFVNQGQAFSEKYGLDFHLVSSRTAEGCHELEASLIAAALNAHDASDIKDPRPGNDALSSKT